MLPKQEPMAMDEVLKELVDSIITSVDHHESSRPLFDRGRWNMQIQRVCFEHIASKVERFFS